MGKTHGWLCVAVPVPFVSHVDKSVEWMVGPYIFISFFGNCICWLVVWACELNAFGKSMYSLIREEATTQCDEAKCCKPNAIIDSSLAVCIVRKPSLLYTTSSVGKVLILRFRDFFVYSYLFWVLRFVFKI